MAFVLGTFLIGWVLGAGSLYRLWTMSDAPRGMTTGGWGYLGFMLAPLCTGILVTLLCSWLAGRGWGWPSLRWVLLGVVGVFAGFVLGA